jgi:hypothetical protein
MKKLPYKLKITKRTIKIILTRSFKSHCSWKGTMGARVMEKNCQKNSKMDTLEVLLK